MKSVFKLVLVVTGVCVLALPVAQAEVPQNMSVQGRLTDPAGDPVAPGLKIFTFKIFSAEVGGTEIWPGGAGEDQTLSTDVNGLWKADVGRNIPLTETVFADTSRWLQVTIDDGINPAETLPRIKLNTNPWACHAEAARTADSADNATLADFALSAAEASNANALDGHPPSDFAFSTHTHAPTDITPQGPASGLNADKLDGAELADIDAQIDTDISVHAASGAHDSRYVDVSGDVMSGSLETPQLNLGRSGIDGLLRLYHGPSGQVVVQAEPAFNGGSVSLYDDGGSYMAGLWPDVDGPGGRLEVMGQFGYLEVDGNYAGFGDPRWTLTGSQSTLVFDTRSTGTDAVRLPDNAIDTSEILDEPGITSANSGQLDPFTNAMQDIETVSITIPAGGYIVVEGDCIGRESGTVGKAQGWIQIDETAGGAAAPPHALFFGLASHATTAGYNAFPVHVSRVYQKGVAGTYTFRMEGMTVSGNSPGANVSAVSATLTATYYPTSYGSVATLVSAAETGEFERATAVAIDADPTDPAAPKGGDVLYEVDLRDLELKLARARAEAERAERELMEARMNSRQGRPLAIPED